MAPDSGLFYFTTRIGDELHELSKLQDSCNSFFNSYCQFNWGSIG